MRRMIRITLFVTLLFLSLPVLAADGYVISDVNLRAGPGTDYPSITVIPKWTGLQVQGCVDGYSWCDVQVGPDRGWVYGQYLEFMRGNEPVFIEDSGPQLGIPIVTFSVATYWDSYYRTRPWYSRRAYWVSRPPPIYRPPPARPPGMRPPPRPPFNGGRPPINRPPPPRPRPPSQGGPGGRPPITKPPPRPPVGAGPGGRPPNPGNGAGGRPPNPGNRPRPGDSNNGKPPPRPQPREAPQNGG